jgi:hypothetical protein
VVNMRVRSRPYAARKRPEQGVYAHLMQILWLAIGFCGGFATVHPAMFWSRNHLVLRTLLPDSVTILLARRTAFRSRASHRAVEKEFYHETQFCNARRRRHIRGPANLRLCR